MEGIKYNDVSMKNASLPSAYCLISLTGERVREMKRRIVHQPIDRFFGSTSGLLWGGGDGGFFDESNIDILQQEMSCVVRTMKLLIMRQV